MSESMVERVARAICETSDPGGVVDWHEWVDEARAAISAMREPTQAMLDAADLAEKAHLAAGGDPETCADHADVWRAMIDEARAGRVIAEDRSVGADHGVEFQIGLEDDGRWFCEALSLPGVMAYGATAAEALQKAAVLAARVIMERAGVPTAEKPPGFGIVP